MIGVIGYGRFGRLTARHLAADFPVAVHTRDQEKRADIEVIGARLVSLAEACARQTVVLCVPISAMPATLKQVAPLLADGTLVIDVCSVKMLPVQWMRDLLPETVQILATHPMFGPDSAAQTVAGHKMVLCPERIDGLRYQRVRKWLTRKKVTLVETTAEQHDRQIATSLALTHFIGRSLAALPARPLAVDTEGYKRLLHILEVVENDTWQLFADMNRFNPFARDQRRAFMQAMQQIDARLTVDPPDDR